jgi:hypothetical protein
VNGFAENPLTPEGPGRSRYVALDHVARRELCRAGLRQVTATLVPAKKHRYSITWVAPGASGPFLLGCPSSQDTRIASAWAISQIRAAICTAEPKRSLLSSTGSPQKRDTKKSPSETRRRTGWLGRQDSNLCIRSLCPAGFTAVVPCGGQIVHAPAGESGARSAATLRAAR